MGRIVRSGSGPGNGAHAVISVTGLRMRVGMLRAVAEKPAAARISVAVLALGMTLSLACPAGAETSPWFKEALNIQTKVVAGSKCSEVAEKGKGEKDVGGQAVAVFDDNNDGIPDIALVNGSNNFYIDQGKRNAKGEVEYAAEATRYPINAAGEKNAAGEEVASRAKAFGLDDFTRSGNLGLFVGNAGTGTLKLVNPRNLAEAYSPSNLSKSNLCQTNKRRIWTGNGNGTFSNDSKLGEESEGVTRTPLFADFSNDGRQDELDLNAPYYGIWWGNSPAPSSLHPGEANGTFGKNILPEVVVNEKGEPEPELFQEKYGRGDVDIKGAIARELTGDGKPDVIASSYSDQWDGVNEEPYGIAHKEGGEIDLNHPGENIPDGGWQGGWPHGLLALRNASTPGHIKFVNESATAFPGEGFGYGDRMDAYSTIPVDLNHDGKLDLIAIGVRDFTAVNSLEDQTPIITVWKNVSTPEHLRFENVTAESGLQFMNEPEQLEKVTNGHYPVVLKGILEEGAAPESPNMVWEPNLSEGAAVDLTNSGNPDLVMIDRQFKSANPLTGEEFYPWVFENLGNFKFRWVPPSESGMQKTGRAISYGDLYGNGREDVVSVNGSGGGQSVEDSNNIWKNEIASTNNWVEIKVRSASDAMGPLGLGAMVTVYKAGTSEILGDEEVSTDYSYRSKRDALLHFGLGTATAVDVHVEGPGDGAPVTVHNLPVNGVDTITMPPQAPSLASGTTPNKTGVFSLSWAGVGGNNAGFTYTLQQKNASGGWTNVATGLTAPEYAFTAQSPETEGTWAYRVMANYQGVESESSPVSAEVKVDETTPIATPTAERSPDYSGGGGWYKDSVTISFASSSDPNLSDGSAGSGVNPASIPAPETFSTSGSHAACGTVKDDAGNESAPGCVTVQVDATPPSLEITCPTTAEVGSSANAAFSASDAYSGLASEASGTVPIETRTAGEKTVSTTAVSNVGLETTKSCTTITTPKAPAVVTESASSVTQTSATLNASVNPEGGNVSDCHFEYGTTSAYGASVPCASLPGSGESPVAVLASLSMGSLSEDTTYHFRIVATNATGTSYGSDVSFTTLPNAPAVVTEGASSVTQTSATLNASVNPQGGNVSSCSFEYGTTEAYGSAVACSPSPGSGEAPVLVSASVAGLATDTTYHFRIVATNPGGTSYGSDNSFMTLPPPSPAHWFKSGTKLKQGTSVPIIYWGGAVNVSLSSGAGEINCKTVASGYIENPVGGGSGIGQTVAVSYYECKAPRCESEIAEAPLAGLGYRGVGFAQAYNLPWKNELIGSAPLLQDRIGAPAGGNLGTGFPEGYPASSQAPDGEGTTWGTPGAIGLISGCQVFPNPEGAPALGDASGSPSRVASETPFEGELRPEIGGSLNGAASASNPAQVRFAGKASGELKDNLGPGGGGVSGGSLKYLGYATQSPIKVE